MTKLKVCNFCRKNNENKEIAYESCVDDDVYICPTCGHKLIDTCVEEDDFYIIIKVTNDWVPLLEAMIALKESDPIEYQLKMSQFKANIAQQESAKVSNKNTVKCPKCGSTNIQIVPRKWSLLTGFMTNKTDRVCVNCKNKF